MISVGEATDTILKHTLTLPSEEVSLSQCSGRVLREDLIADRDFPPFDRVTMDGIAIDFGRWQSGTHIFPIQEIAPAGHPQAHLSDPSLCIEIMTGAVLPAGCDTVIRYEDLKIEKGRAEVFIPEISQGQNVHKQGTDRKQGDIIVRHGKQLAAAEIGVAATIGKSKLLVSAPPRIAVVSTGDELVDVDTVPLPHQIRQSNAQQIKAILEQYGLSVICHHVRDDTTAVENTLERICAEHDCIILSGGVSAGKYDYVPRALEKLGVEKLFHQVAQRPGKPFWFGFKSTSGASGFIPDTIYRGPVAFALPGNPVSSFMCTIRYVTPWLEATLGIAPNPQYAILTEDVAFRPALTYFLQVELECKSDGSLYATPVAGHGSGDLANLADADGFLELPGGEELYRNGEIFRVWWFR